MMTNKINRFQIKWLSHLLSAGLSVMALHAQAADTIHIYAASSMTNVVDEIAKNYQQNHSVKIVPVYGGSSTLARQIEQGAPADIFISANPKWMDYLSDQQQVLDETVVNLVSNDLVLIAPKDAPKVASGERDDNRIKQNLAQLDGERLAVAMTDSVPAGIYAKQALETMGLWDKVADSLAPTSNVRLTLALVERQEAPLGIVYRTDAILSQKVRIAATFAAGTHEPIIYPMAQLSKDPDVQNFYQYLRSDAAYQVYDSYGFRPYREVAPQSTSEPADNAAKEAKDAALLAPALKESLQGAIDSQSSID